jgi:putative ABC transport system substrate-binding protein
VTGPVHALDHEPGVGFPTHVPAQVRGTVYIASRGDADAQCDLRHTCALRCLAHGAPAKARVVRELSGPPPLIMSRLTGSLSRRPRQYAATAAPRRSDRLTWITRLGVLAFALVFSLTAAPLGVGAAQPEKLHHIGMLERTPAVTNGPNVNGFRQGLRELGYVEGKSFVIDYRSADGHDERFPALATELVRLKVDLIVTRGTPAALAAKNATRTTPVVITGVGDPVGQGVVSSLARPGANITGLSAAVTEIYPKRVQLLRELVPKAARIAVLFNMSNPALPPQWEEVKRAARSLRIEPQLLDVRKPGDLEPAFEAAIRQHADALVVGIDTLTQANQRLIVDLAARHRLPAIYASTEFTGGLISYGVNYPEMYRGAAKFADKIFKGEKPADLPVEEPTRFELVINSKTARALGLTIPPALLLRADRVIEGPSMARPPSSKAIGSRAVESP